MDHHVNHDIQEVCLFTIKHESHTTMEQVHQQHKTNQKKLTEVNPVTIHVNHFAVVYP